MRSKPWPAPLGHGDLVGVWAPASPPREDEVARGLQVLEGAGLRVCLASNLRAKKLYLAGGDEARLAGLHELLQAGVKALWAVRGGYGVMRLLPRIPWDQLASWGGWLVGYSDLTALHCAACRRFPRVTIHGPMVTALGRAKLATARVLAMVQGEPPKVLFRFSPRAVLRGGRACGWLVGGNLSLLASLVGTPYEPPWEGVVLAVEEVGEPGYRLDRLLTQLALAGKLERLAGVLVGGLSRCGRGEAGFRAAFAERLLELTPSRCPVVMGLPFGHLRRNLAFPVGAAVVLDTDRGTVCLEEDGD